MFLFSICSLEIYTLNKAVRYGRVPKRSRDHSSNLATNNTSNSTSLITVNSNNNNGLAGNNNNGININNNNINHINRNTVPQPQLPAPTQTSVHSTVAATAQTSGHPTPVSQQNKSNGAAAADVVVASAAGSASSATSSTAVVMNHNANNIIDNGNIIDHLLAGMPTSLLQRQQQQQQHPASVPMMDATEQQPSHQPTADRNGSYNLGDITDEEGAVGGVAFNDNEMPSTSATLRPAADDNTMMNSNQPTVYEVIRLIGEGHLTFCTFVEEHIPPQRRALEIPPLAQLQFNDSIALAAAAQSGHATQTASATAAMAQTESAADATSTSSVATIVAAAAVTVSDGSVPSAEMAMELPTNATTADQSLYENDVSGVATDHESTSSMVSMSTASRASSRSAGSSSSSSSSPVAEMLLLELDLPRAWLWQECSARITPAVQHVVEFAKRIPGFPQFTADDQLILIKVGFFEVWLAQVTRFGMSGSGGYAEALITFDDGYFVTGEQLSRMYNVSVGVCLRVCKVGYLLSLK